MFQHSSVLEFHSDNHYWQIVHRQFHFVRKSIFLFSDSPSFLLHEASAQIVRSFSCQEFHVQSRKRTWFPLYKEIVVPYYKSREEFFPKTHDIAVPVFFPPMLLKQRF